MVGAVVTELQVVGTGDVGRRCSPGIRVLRVVENVVDAPVDAEGRHDRRHLHQVRQRAGLLHPAPVTDEGRVAGFEQQLVRDRRGPRHLRDDFARVPVVGVGFRREPRAEDSAGYPVRPSRTAAAALAHAALIAIPLVVVIEAELVARRRLRGQSHGGDGFRGGRPRLDGGIRRIVPMARIAGKLIRVQPGDVGVVPFVAVVGKEPELVPDDGSTQRRADVP